MVVLERGEIPNQVWNDIYLLFFLRPFIIVFFFDLSSTICRVVKIMMIFKWDKIGQDE